MVKFLLIVALIFLGLRLFWSGLFRSLTGFTPEEMRDRQREAYENQRAASRPDARAEGDVRVEYKRDKKPPPKDVGGEYVDYEEVD
ncbi:MAG: DUF4834 family protein [Flavobacteriales bacterium]|nr:DUF4834 family protein [Flavobacteriales bacterium]